MFPGIQMFGYSKLCSVVRISVAQMFDSSLFSNVQIRICVFECSSTPVKATCYIDVGDEIFSGNS